MVRYLPISNGKYTITSRFAGRTNPVTGRPENHSGTDFAAPDGTPFYAVASGTVKYIGAASGYGQWIVIQSPSGSGDGVQEYGHMWNAYATGLKVGDQVQAGQKIGYVGSNGQSTGPHLHVTVWSDYYGGTRTDPETYLAGAKDPSGKKPSSVRTLFGIDISDHQGNMDVKYAIESEGLDFIILRLCDGTYVDKRFKSYLAQAEKTKALVNAYWYVRAPSEGTTFDQQIDVIDRQFGGRKDIGVWLDIESIDSTGRPILTKSDVWTAKRALERRGYYVPGVYSGAWYWEVMPGGEPSMDGLGYLWVSNYGRNIKGDDRYTYELDGGDDRRGWTYPLGDRKPDVLQFSSQGVVGNVFPIDCNAFKGSRAQLEAIFKGKTAPKPEGELSMSDVNTILKEMEKLKTYLDRRVTGPVGTDVKDIRQQLTGGRDSIPGNLQASYPGHDMKRILTNVVEKDFDNLTLVDMVVLLLLGSEEQLSAVRSRILESD